MLYGSRKTLDILDKAVIAPITDKDILSELDQKTIELKKERQKLSDQRTAFNKIVRETARSEELKEILEQTVAKGDLPSLEFDIEGVNYIPGDNNDLLVSLNDIHYGANHDSYWCTYNSEICKEMMSEYAVKIIDIAQLHNSENCYVFCGGDTISGSIHKTLQITNKENVIEQITGVSELIAEFLAYLGHFFEKVVFFSVAGNHSRMDKKEDALPGERLDDLVGWYLKARLQNRNNIVVEGAERIDPTMCFINIRGKNYCGIHGDIETRPINVQTLQTMCGVPLYAVLSGHLHHNAIDNIQGIKTVMAGSFLGMDDYCIQKRIVGKPEQMVCVCNEDGILCHYDITF